MTGETRRTPTQEDRFWDANPDAKALEDSGRVVLIERRSTDYRLYEVRRRQAGYLQFVGQYAFEPEARRAWEREAAS